MLKMYICIRYTMPTIWEYVSVQDICGYRICPIQIYIFRIVHSPTKPSNLHSAPKCWHAISNTNICIQLTHTPQIVGSINLIQIYIFKNVHSPTLCPKGTQKPSNLHSSPKCWYNISNTNIYIFN